MGDSKRVMRGRTADVDAGSDHERFRGFLIGDGLKHIESLLKAQSERYQKRLKRCQENVSEQAVHKSRMETRRLLSILEVLDAILGDHLIKKAHRALKRHLNTFDELRDTQVQLLYVGKMLSLGSVARRFQIGLLKREKKQTASTRKRIKRVKTNLVRKSITRAREALIKEHGRLTSKQVGVVLLRTLNRAFTRVERLKTRIDPAEAATIHRTRVAFKMFRYMVEALAPLLPGATKSRLAALHDYQTVMGDIQDLDVLSAAFETFLQEHEFTGESAFQIRDELARRRQWSMRHFVDTAETLHEFKLLLGSGPVRQGR